jgi:cystathionine beta-lyase
MDSQFERKIDRKTSNSLKWDRYKGKDVIPFWLADMEFACAPAIMEAMRKRLEHPIFGYTTPGEEHYDAILGYLRKEKNIPAEADWIQWLPGLVPALGSSCRAYARIGEGVMYCPPVYPQFMAAPVNQRRRPVPVPLARDGMHYTFDWEKMEAAANGVKVFILCNPHNPVGRLFSAKELERLASFCAARDIAICSDEIHCDLVMEPGLRHTSILNIPQAATRSVLLMSPSKTYNTPGLSCAFAVIPDPKMRTEFKRTIRGSHEWVNIFGMEACRAAYAECGKWRGDLLRYLRGNRDYLRDCIETHIPEIKVGPCEGTYMAWLDARELGLEDPAAFFERAGVGFSDGTDYGERDMLRMNYACPRQMLEEGLRRMDAAVATLRVRATAPAPAGIAAWGNGMNDPIPAAPASHA